MKLIRVSAVVALSASICLADANVEQKSQMHIGGAVGALVNVFSRSAREGTTSQTIIKGDRKFTRNGDNGEIIDLSAEKVYSLDFDRNTYTVKTFAELRREYEEQKARAEKEAREAKKTEKTEKNEGPEYEVDFAVKSTGNKETINGWNTHQEIFTVTVHEKGKTLEKSGGWVLTSDMWMGPKIPAMREIVDFDMRFAKKIYGSAIGDMQKIAMAMAATPAFAKAMKTMSEKKGSFDGTPVRTKMTFEVVAGTDPSTQQKAENDSTESSSPQNAVIGGLFNKMKQRREKQKAERGEDPNRSTLLDSSTELTRATSTASAADVAIPAGFKQR